MLVCVREGKVRHGAQIRKLNIAILGASGFLGSNLAQCLNSFLDFHVRGFSRSGKLGLETYEIFFSDIDEFDFIVNASVGYGRQSAYEAYLANVEFPLSVLDRLLQSRHPVNFINLDSFFTKFSIPFYSQLKAYSLTKALFPDLATSRILQSENQEVRFANFRVEHVFGDGDSPAKFVTWLRREMISNAPRISLTSGLQKRDFVHVSDASGLIAAGISVFDELDLSRPLEVGTGQSMEVRTFVELAAQTWGFKGQLAFGEIPDRLGEIQESKADPYLARTANYESFVSLSEALRSAQ